MKRADRTAGSSVSPLRRSPCEREGLGSGDGRFRESILGIEGAPSLWERPTLGSRVPRVDRTRNGEQGDPTCEGGRVVRFAARDPLPRVELAAIPVGGRGRPAAGARAHGLGRAEGKPRPVRKDGEFAARVDPTPDERLQATALDAATGPRL